MMTAVVDATIFAQQFVAVAEECGLGTVYLGTVMYDLQGLSLIHISEPTRRSV